VNPGEDYIGITTPFYCHDGNGRIVMQKRNSNARDEHGRWDPGSGKLEKGLTLEENVKKEVREEYGCECTVQESLPPHGIFRGQDGEETHWLAVPFFVRVDPEEVENGEPEKFDEINWFDIDNLPENLHTGFEYTFKNYRDKFSEIIGEKNLEPEDLKTLFEDIESLKHTEREGWKKKGIKSPSDTIATHSFGAALLAWLLADSERIESEKAVKMAVAHDFMMARMPDLTPEDEDYGRKKELEKDSIEEMREEYPELAEEIFELIEEVQKRETEEAKIVKKADKLDTLMQAESYEERIDEPLMKEFVQGFEKYFDEDTAADDLFNEFKQRTNS